MGKAAQPQIVDARAQAIQFRFVLGNENLAMAFEAATVADKVLDPLPQFHGRDRERHFGDMAGKLAHAARIHARCVPADIILFDEQRLYAP